MVAARAASSADWATKNRSRPGRALAPDHEQGRRGDRGRPGGCERAHRTRNTAVTDRRAEREGAGEQLGDAEQSELGHRGLDHREADREDGELRGEREGPQQDGRGATEARDTPGDEEVGEQGHEEEELHRARPLDEREVAARVLEHHRLVDHRQLEVRGRVVDGQASGLREHHDEEGREGEEVPGIGGEAGLAAQALDDAAQVGRVRAQGEGEDGHDDRGLGERGHRDLAARRPCRRTRCPRRDRPGRGRTSPAGTGT